MKVDAATFRRLLPALQHLAHFPRANGEKICRRHGLDYTEVVQAIAEMAGPPTFWDVEVFAEFAGKLGVEVPKFDPLRIGRSPDTPAGGSAPDPEPSAETWTRVKRVHEPAVERYLPVVRALANDKGDQAAWLGRAHGNAWAQFKLAYFGKGAVAPSRALAFLRWYSERTGKDHVGPARQAPTLTDAERAEGSTDKTPPVSEDTLHTSSHTRDAMTYQWYQGIKGATGPMLIQGERDLIGEQLDELAQLATAYKGNRDRGWPCVILRRALLEAVREVAAAANAEISHARERRTDESKP